MNTVYLDSDALKTIKKDFRSRDFQLPAEYSLKLELTDSFLGFDCSINNGYALFEISYRTLPPGLKDNDRIKIKASDLSVVRDFPDDLGEAVLNIDGIEPDNEIAVYALFVSEVCRSWLEDRALPEPGEGIIYITGEDAEIKVVSGSDRPELNFFKLNEETGESEVCSLRMYPGDIASGSDLGMLSGDVLYLSKQITDPDTGKVITVPVIGSEAKAIRAKLAMINEGQRIEKEWPGKITNKNNKYGRPGYFGIGTEETVSSRIFVSADTMQKLPSIPLPPGKLPDALCKSCLVDMTDVPCFAIIELDRERRKTEMTVFRRIAVLMDSPAVGQFSHVRISGREYMVDGNIELAGGEAERNLALSIALGFKKLACLLAVSGCMVKLRSVPMSGISVEYDGDNIVISQISGADRPELPSHFAGDFCVMRTYADEHNTENDEELPGSSDIIAVLSPEKISALLTPDADKHRMPAFESPEAEIAWLEAEAAKGSTDAMKRLGKKYETGEGVSADAEKALSLYRKALEICPEDKDLEFDIFMLEMIM